MKRIASAAALVVACLGATLALSAAQKNASDVDAAFKAYWDAPLRQGAAEAVPGILASGVTFGEAWRRLKEGRPYPATVKKGVQKYVYYGANGLVFYYSVDVPESYNPARRYQVRIQLHGGVSRPGNELRGNGSIGSLAGAEQIYVLPAGWKDAPWWSADQVENLGVILDAVKRTYNVDENRVVLSGVSDGGTGAYHVAMHDTTPYASFLPLNGYIMVLRSVYHRGDEFPNNLRNKPFFIVNGGMDPLYPTSIVGPKVAHLRTSGVELVYQPQPDAAHNTSWWPDVKDSFEAFVSSHPRKPFPDTLTWESADDLENRAHWLIIDKLAARTPGDGPALDDVNREGDRIWFEHHFPSGRVDLVRSGNTVKATTRGVAAFTLLLSPEVFDFDKPVRVEADGRVVFDGRVEKSLPTLLKWAARDNDRTMLVAAEVHVTRAASVR